MSATQKRIEELKHEAEECHSAWRLWKIANSLIQLGAWDEAQAAANKAKRIEDKSAAEVGR